ncbi:MAG TPA: hypothetical protein VGM56_32140 [Byssovorax sp.]
MQRKAAHEATDVTASSEIESQAANRRMVDDAALSAGILVVEVGGRSGVVVRRPTTAELRRRAGLGGLTTSRRAAQADRAMGLDHVQDMHGAERSKSPSSRATCRAAGQFSAGVALRRRAGTDAPADGSRARGRPLSSPAARFFGVRP